MQKLNEIFEEFNAHISQIIEQPGTPREVYDPISYILEIGGKRIRPIMAIAAYRLFNEKTSTEVIKLGQAIEMFHNFTLMHDDIMDNSMVRRGNETVHIKWNQSTAILSGDLLQIEVYEKLTSIGNIQILSQFNQMARELCEGQMNDMKYENEKQVSNTDYLHMIRQKTAVLLGFSLQSGAILGGASTAQSQKLYELGVDIGLSFQLMDDYLDSFGQQAKVGKKIGGDIMNRKKTYLWNEMWGKLTKSEKNEILDLYKTAQEDDLIAHIKHKMEITGAKNQTLLLAKKYTHSSLEILRNLEVSGDKTYLTEIIDMLTSREN